MARKGQSNTYELRLPGGEVKTKCPLLTPDRTIRWGGSYDPPEVTTQVDGSELRASAPATSTVRTQIDGTQARPLTGAGEPLPESSTKRKAAAAAAIASFDATFDPITEAQRWAEAVEAVRPAVSRVIGCPACGSDRLMGGSCDQCGHDIGLQFRASADWNMSGGYIRPIIGPVRRKWAGIGRELTTFRLTGSSLTGIGVRLSGFVRGRKGTDGGDSCGTAAGVGLLAVYQNRKGRDK